MPPLFLELYALGPGFQDSPIKNGDYPKFHSNDKGIPPQLLSQNDAHSFVGE
jgi:hypothetical protein